MIQGLSRLPSQVTDSRWEIWDKELGGDTQRLGWAAKQPLGNAALGALFA